MIAGQTMDWSRLGYVQLVREHVELCSAVMLLADIHRMKSPAKKLLLFPRVWLKKSEDDTYDPRMTTTRRLLRTAARRYGVSLIPIETIVDGADGKCSGDGSHPLQQHQQLTVRPTSRHIAVFIFAGKLVLSHRL
jgi:hypothetical protein